jgi:hypothetical protein
VREENYCETGDEEVAKDTEAAEFFGLWIKEAVPNDAVGHPKQADDKAD